MMKRFVSRILTAVVASSLIVTPVMAAPSVDELESEKAAAQGQVSSLQSQLTDIVEKIDQLESDLVDKQDEITKATDDLGKAEDKEEQQYEDMKLRIKYMYEGGNENLIETLFTSEDFGDLINKAEYVSNVNTYDRDKLDEYVETVQEVKDLKTKLEKEEKELEKTGEEFEAQQDDLNSLISSKEAEISNLDGQIQEAVAEAARKREEEEAAAQAAAEEEEAAEEETTTNDTDTEEVKEETKEETKQENTEEVQEETQTQTKKSTTKKTQTKKSSSSSSSSSESYSGGDSSKASTIVSAAYSQLGVPYVYGACSPGSAFDCSGLVMYCHSCAGISLSHSSGSIGSGGKSVSSPQAGDCVCYSGHVGIYIGGGKMIHAPHTGDVVKVASVYGSPWYRRYW